MGIIRESLFRKQAVDNNRERLHGDILLVPHLPHTIITVFLISWLVVLAVWLSFSRYVQKETVYGWLEPSSGVVRIFPQQTAGIVYSLLVQEGEMVQESQPLATIKSTRVMADGGSLSSELLAESELQRQRITRQLERGEAIFSRQESDLRKKLVAAKDELLLIDRQIVTVGKRYKLISAQLKNAIELQTAKFISNLELEKIQAQELELLESLQVLERQHIRQSNSITELQNELDLIPDQAILSQDALKDRLSDVTQRIAQIGSEQSYTIVSPRAGFVNNLQATEGQSVQLGGSVPLMSIVPSDSTLTVQLMVPVRSAGFIEEGQMLTIRYDAFPYQKFGTYSGTIENISNTVLLPAEVLNAPIVVNEPMYRIVGNLSDSTVRAYGRELFLKPGMTLSADIELSERSLIEWIFEPVLSLRGRL